MFKYALSFSKRGLFRQMRWSSNSPTNQSRSPTVHTISLGTLPKKLSKVEKVLNQEKPDQYEINEFKKRDLPPSLKAVREMMDKYKDYVVITQLGSFFELYFEHAVEYSPKLNLTLAKRSLKESAIPMAGFPLSQLDRHLKVLVQDLNVGVAIVEQFKNETGIDNEVQKVTRRLTRIITPGTLVDEVFLNEQENNYLLSVDFPDTAFKREALPDLKIGLAWTDLSVGSIFVQETTLKDLISTITRIKPSEILLDEKLVPEQLESGEWYSELVELKRYFRKFQALPSLQKTLDLYNHMFSSFSKTAENTMKELPQKETAALRNLLQYIENHLPDSPINLQLPVRQIPENIMQIDSRTSDALELHKTFKDEGRKGSLISSVKRTVTQSGARLLSQWISAPSTDLKEIKNRQALVTLFFKNTIFRTNVIAKLTEVHDISRIVQRFALGRGTALDLVYLARSIEVVGSLQSILKMEAVKSKANAKVLEEYLENYDSLENLSKTILDNLDEVALLQTIRSEQEELEKEIAPSQKSQLDEELVNSDSFLWTVRPNASKGLSKLHEMHNSLLNEKAALIEHLEKVLLVDLKFKSVEFKFSPSLGYQLYLRAYKGSDHDRLKELLPEATISQKSSSTKWLNYPNWSSLGSKIDSIKHKIRAEEDNVIKTLKKDVVRQSLPLRNVANWLDFLDVTSSFAVLSLDRNLVCPSVDDSLELEIKNGRHLVVEEGLKQSLKNFTPNNFEIGKNDQMWVISGPNMGGKSTFLRQNAIIVILAQIGCYVPAESARIGIVDKIFSRVGAADDLYNEMSTFMVEMVETSYILKGATVRSLAILDEVGRGTSGREGLAIAFATLDHMVKVNRCRGLFATHFGQELHGLLSENSSMDRVTFKRTKIGYFNNKLLFDHTLEDGISEKSYAINVAALAGFPKEALLIADKALKTLQ